MGLGHVEDDEQEEADGTVDKGVANKELTVKTNSP